MKDFTKEDFKFTTSDLSEAHGSHLSTITTWTKDGAFPYARREGGRTSYYYPEEAMKLTMGQIKENRSKGTYKEPIIILDPLPQSKKGLTLKDERFCELLDRFDQIDRKLTRIETKLHAVAEGRPLRGLEYQDEAPNPTIGDMVNKTLHKHHGQ